MELEDKLRQWCPGFHSFSYFLKLHSWRKLQNNPSSIIYWPIFFNFNALKVSRSSLGKLDVCWMDWPEVAVSECLAFQYSFVWIKANILHAIENCGICLKWNLWSISDIYFPIDDLLLCHLYWNTWWRDKLTSFRKHRPMRQHFTLTRELWSLTNKRRKKT